MAETLVKNPTCSKCGEDARPQALFCHACGGEIIDLPKDQEGDVSSAWFKEDIVDAFESTDNPSAAAAERKKIDVETSELAEDEKQEDARSEGIGESSDSEALEKQEKDKAENQKDTTVRKKIKLKSAAELRRKPKSVRSKRVEIVWEENSDSPNLMFLVFGLLIVLVAGVFLFLAFYLR